MFPTAKKKFLDLVTKVASGKTARSENDLSSQLASYLQSLGLATVVDTSGGARGHKRPDIRGYSSATNADLVLPAEIVIESKKPAEVKAYPNLRAAMVADEIWEEKTLPYVRENLEKIRYFVLTTFVSFAVVEFTADLRRQFAELNGARSETEIKKVIAKVSLEFVLKRLRKIKNGS